MTLKNSLRKIKSVLPSHFNAVTALILLIVISSCSVQYSLSGVTIDAKTLTIIEFYNNADLGPANMGQTFSNDLRNYFTQNTSLRVVPEEGELQIEGEIMNFTLTPIAPVSTGNPDDLNQASSTRLTIIVKATYINSLKDEMSFKDKTFSFYKDFPNDQNIADVQDQYTKQIFERIINDIFNASVANW